MDPSVKDLRDELDHAAVLDTTDEPVELSLVRVIEGLEKLEADDADAA